MGKTNRERAGAFVTKWWSAVCSKVESDLPAWALNLLIDMAQVCINKSEKRGRQDALNDCPRITRYCKVYTEPPPFDAEKAKELINKLIHDTYSIAAYSSQENQIAQKITVSKLYDELGIGDEPS